MRKSPRFEGNPELLPVRRLQGDVQCGRPLHPGPADALDTRQVRGETPARDERTPPPLLRPAVEVRLQWGRLHRRIHRRRETLPLPRQQHRDPMDPRTSSRHQRLTSGQDTRSARCIERCTLDAGGDLRKTGRRQHRHRARGSTSPRRPRRPELAALLGVCALSQPVWCPGWPLAEDVAVLSRCTRRVPFACKDCGPGSLVWSSAGRAPVTFLGLLVRPGHVRPAAGVVGSFRGSGYRGRAPGAAQSCKAASHHAWLVPRMPGAAGLEG
jgi:hypothetical protein